MRGVRPPRKPPATPEEKHRYGVFVPDQGDAARLQLLGSGAPPPFRAAINAAGAFPALLCRVPGTGTFEQLRGLHPDRRGRRSILGGCSAFPAVRVRPAGEEAASTAAAPASAGRPGVKRPSGRGWKALSRRCTVVSTPAKKCARRACVASTKGGWRPGHSGTPVVNDAWWACRLPVGAPGVTPPLAPGTHCTAAASLAAVPVLAKKTRAGDFRRNVGYSVRRALDRGMDIGRHAGLVLTSLLSRSPSRARAQPSRDGGITESPLEILNCSSRGLDVTSRCDPHADPHAPPRAHDARARGSGPSLRGSRGTRT